MLLNTSTYIYIYVYDLYSRCICMYIYYYVYIHTWKRSFSPQLREAAYNICCTRSYMCIYIRRERVFCRHFERVE